MNVKEWLDEQVKKRTEKLDAGKDGILVSKFDSMKLADGTVLSVQASEWHHSTPCETIRAGEDSYEAVEIYFPERGKAGDLERYRSDNDPVLLNYVPVERLQDFVDEHGGIAN